jgi:hypothetical protein
LKLNFTVIVGIALSYASLSYAAAAEQYLLYDDDNHFYGCLNCSTFDAASICNSFGDYGSQFSNDSIWDRFGDVGSRFNEQSPWSKYGQGLKIVDSRGGYYGRVSANKFAVDRIKSFDAWFAYFESLDGDLVSVRKLVCQR